MRTLRAKGEAGEERRIIVGKSHAPQVRGVPRPVKVASNAIGSVRRRAGNAVSR